MKKLMLTLLLLIVLVSSVPVVFAQNPFYNVETRTTPTGDVIKTKSGVLINMMSVFGIMSVLQPTWNNKDCFINKDYAACSYSTTSTIYRDYGVLTWMGYESCQGFMTKNSCSGDCYSPDGTTCSGTSTDSRDMTCIQDKDCTAGQYCSTLGQCQTSISCSNTYFCYSGTIYECVLGVYKYKTNCIYAQNAYVDRCSKSETSISDIWSTLCVPKITTNCYPPKDVCGATTADSNIKYYQDANCIKSLPYDCSKEGKKCDIVNGEAKCITPIITCESQDKVTCSDNSCAATLNDCPTSINGKCCYHPYLNETKLVEEVNLGNIPYNFVANLWNTFYSLLKLTPLPTQGLEMKDTISTNEGFTLKESYFLIGITDSCSRYEDAKELDISECIKKNLTIDKPFIGETFYEIPKTNITGTNEKPIIIQATSYPYDEWKELSSKEILKTVCQEKEDCAPYEDLSNPEREYYVQCKSTAVLMDKIHEAAKKECDSGWLQKILWGSGATATGACVAGVLFAAPSAGLSLTACIPLAAITAGGSIALSAMAQGCVFIKENKAGGVCLATPKEGATWCDFSKKVNFIKLVDDPCTNGNIILGIGAILLIFVLPLIIPRPK